jgi:hypothetical protein
MAFGGADLDDLLEDSPHTITAGDKTAACWFASSDEAVLSRGGTAAQIANVSVAQVKTDDFPNIKGNDAVTIKELNDDGTAISSQNFTVFRREAIQDGAMTELVLKKA